PHGTRKADKGAKWNATFPQPRDGRLGDLVALHEQQPTLWDCRLETVLARELNDADTALHKIADIRFVGIARRPLERQQFAVSFVLAGEFRDALLTIAPRLVVIQAEANRATFEVLEPLRPEDIGAGQPQNVIALPCPGIDQLVIERDGIPGA